MNERSDNRHFQLLHSHLCHLPREPLRISAQTLYCQKRRSLGYIFVADSIWVALQIFEQFCPKAGDANSLVAEPETDFNAKWSFKAIKVIYFGIIEETLRGYIAQYNNCGLECEGSEDIASDFGTNQKRVFDFLLMINPLSCVLHRFGDTAA